LRVFALSRASEKILRAADAWSGSTSRANRTNACKSGTRMFHRMAGTRWYSTRRRLPSAISVSSSENSLLQAALGDAARRAGVNLLTGEVDCPRAGARCRRVAGRGRSVSARLVVGADGAQSRVRELAGLTAVRTDYGQSAIVAMVQD
jgi:2-polyprenyl-6-methoxyphenol hydroxylase-like FAD-dependent oxidoreductase